MTPSWPFAVNRESPLARGLVGWWSARAGGADNLALDLAGPRNDGVVGIPLGLDAEHGPHWTFNQDGYVEVSDQNSLDFGLGDFSYDAWVRTSEGATTISIFDKRTPSWTGFHAFLSGGNLGFQLCDGTFENHITGTSIADGAWHHIACSLDRDNSSGLVQYVDGVAVDTSDPTARTGDTSTTQNLLIGGHVTGSSSYWIGDILELRMWERKLLPTEVWFLYAMPTRFDLYKRDDRRNYFVPPPAYEQVSFRFRNDDGTLGAPP